MGSKCEWRFGSLGLVLLLLSSLAWASEPWKGFDSKSSHGTKLPANFNGFLFSDKSDANAGWMHLIHLNNGGWINLLYSVANMGPYHHSSSIAVLYVHPNGTKYRCDAQWSDSEEFKRTTPNDYFIEVHHSHFGGKYPDFMAAVDDGGCKGQLTFKATVPSFTQGSGVVRFGDSGEDTWRLMQLAPRATAKGYIQFPGGRVEVDGFAYLEAMFSDIVIPSMADRWYMLRAVNGEYTINLFDMVLDHGNYGDGNVQTLLVARGNKILMGTTQMTYKPVGGRVDPESGNLVPAAFRLDARDGSTSLKGTVRVGKIMDSLDVLSNSPLFIRLVGGLLHGTPWQYRSAAEYDLVLNENGKESRIKGVGYKEIHFYDK